MHFNCIFKTRSPYPTPAEYLHNSSNVLEADKKFRYSDLGDPLEEKKPGNDLTFGGMRPVSIYYRISASLIKAHIGTVEF